MTSFGTSTKPAADQAASHQQAIVARSVVAHPAYTVNAAAPNANYLAIVHRHLRGHYTVCVVLGLLIGATAAFFSRRLGHAIYESQGLIQIANARPAVMPGPGVDPTMTAQQFDAFLQSQKLLISSRRIVDAAVQDPVWRAMDQAVPQPPDKFFSEHMKVDVRPRTELIQIIIDDPNPGTAAAAVTSVINAFSDYYNSEEKRSERQIMGVLNDNRDALQAEIKRLSDLVDEGSRKFGGTTPEIRCNAAAREVDELEFELRKVDAAIASAPATAEAPAKSPADAKTDVPKDASGASDQDLTPDQLALTDPGMQQLLDEQLRVEQEARHLSEKYGPAHPQILANAEALKDLKERVARRAVALNLFRRTMPRTNGSSSDPRGLPVQSAKDLAQMRKVLAKQRDEARQKMDELATTGIALARNQEILARKKTELASFEARIEMLRNQGALGGRLTVITSGDVPLSPARDTRIRIAAATGATGLLLPAAFILSLSLVRKRYRYADDTEVGQPARGPARLLGVLPELRGANSTADQLAAASQSVHHIRLSLDAGIGKSGAQCFLITSATAGEGKTTLALSLGLSFAASQVRTLLIDADLIARKLTNGLEAQDTEGLCEAIKSGTLRQRVRRTDSGVYVLTAGKADASAACAIPRPALKAILAEARRYFDVILIDSGPITGSLEASTIAPEADGVIIAISRGQNRANAEAAISRLNRLGATVVGCVFNRAKSGDTTYSSYASSSRLSLPAESPAPRIFNQFVGEKFGPVVQAVAAGMPEPQN